MPCSGWGLRHIFALMGVLVSIPHFCSWSVCDAGSGAWPGILSMLSGVECPVGASVLHA